MRLEPAIKTADFDTRRANVLAQLDKDIEYFKGESRTKRILYRIAQIFSLGCSSAVPVLLVVDQKNIEPWTTAIVAAVSAFATAAIGLFKLREEWIEAVLAREALISERLAFDALVGEHYGTKSHEDALNNIIRRRHQILDSNLNKWRQTLLLDRPAQPNPKFGPDERPGAAIAAEPAGLRDMSVRT